MDCSAAALIRVTLRIGILLALVSAIVSGGAAHARNGIPIGQTFLLGAFVGIGVLAIFFAVTKVIPKIDHFNPPKGDWVGLGVSFVAVTAVSALFLGLVLGLYRTAHLMGMPLAGFCGWFALTWNWLQGVLVLSPPIVEVVCTVRKWRHTAQEVPSL